MSEYLSLKWGTLKGCNLESDASKAPALKFSELGMSMSAMSQEMTDGHKDALCELIDVVDGPITNDWSGDEMNKGEAKKYVREYGIPTIK